VYCAGENGKCDNQILSFGAAESAVKLGGTCVNGLFKVVDLPVTSLTLFVERYASAMRSDFITYCYQCVIWIFHSNTYRLFSRFE